MEEVEAFILILFLLGQILLGLALFTGNAVAGIVGFIVLTFGTVVFLKWSQNV